MAKFKDLGNISEKMVKNMKVFGIMGNITAKVKCAFQTVISMMAILPTVPSLGMESISEVMERDMRASGKTI